jgi:CBS domain containing-hemolysin-like protein
MQRSGAHLAQVNGPEGRLLGVVALEDVLEELVGEIRDEAGTREHEVVPAPAPRG